MYFYVLFFFFTKHLVDRGDTNLIVYMVCPPLSCVITAAYLSHSSSDIVAYYRTETQM